MFKRIREGYIPKIKIHRMKSQSPDEVNVGFFAGVKQKISKLWKGMLNGTFDGERKRSKAKCAHNDVTVRTIHPVTHQPKMGFCRQCGEMVRAKIKWR